MHHNHYGRLAVMAILSFVAMYVLMYAMVDRFENVFPNVNQLYMAGLMTAPMVVIEILLMGMMYQNRTANLSIIAGAVVAGCAFFLLIRDQTAVADRQFLKSMIPHHASAVLMCGKADIKDGEIKELCRTIIAGQSAEIAQMKAKLATLAR